MKCGIFWLVFLGIASIAFADSPSVSKHHDAQWKAAVEKRRKCPYLAPTRIHAISRRLDGAGTVKSEVDLQLYP